MTEWVSYCGRQVPKENFRVFVYSVNDEQKVVNSFNEYERALYSGLWFATKGFKEIKEIKELKEEAPKKRKA